MGLSNIKINFLERRESNPGPPGEKQECYRCAMQAPWARLRLFSCSTDLKDLGFILPHYSAVGQTGRTVFPNSTSHKFDQFSMAVPMMRDESICFNRSLE